MIGDRAHIARPCHIAARHLTGLNHLCTHIVRDGSSDNGDFLCCICRRLHRGCRNRTDQIDLITDKALHYVLEVRLICLCILPINRNVFPLLKSARLQTIHKATACIVERTVLDKLDNTNFIVRLSRFLWTAAAARKYQYAKGSGAKSNRFYKLCHPHGLPTFS